MHPAHTRSKPVVAPPVVNVTETPDTDPCTGAAVSWWNGDKLRRLQHWANIRRATSHRRALGQLMTCRLLLARDQEESDTLPQTKQDSHCCALDSGLSSLSPYPRGLA